jgi:hypothetical protein
MDSGQQIHNQGSGNIFVQNTGSHVEINVAGLPYLTLIPARARIQNAPLNSEIDRGDVGTVVHVYKNGAAYEVEFVDGGGATIALITVDTKAVRRIMPGEVLHARRTA